MLLTLLAHLVWTAPACAAPLREVGREQFSPRVDEGRVQTGFLDAGVFFSNPHNGASARPDGSGAALFKYQNYLEDAVNADRLKFLADLVFLTDRDASRAYKPVSFDYLLGFSSRLDDLRVQFDREETLSTRGGAGGWRYWDMRGSYLFGNQSTGAGFATGSNARWKLDGWSGALTLGYLLRNGGTPARLDNTGKAEWRYDGVLKGSLYEGRLLLHADADMLTDHDRNRMKPADLDFSLGVGTTYDDLEIMVYRKTRESLDGQGYALSYLLNFLKRFDSRKLLSTD